MTSRKLWLTAGLLVVAIAAYADKPLRFETAGTFHYNGSAQVEYAFPLSQSSLGLDGGVSYGTRDWWNSLSAGITWYPLSTQADGLLLQAQETYGFGVPSIQGDAGRDWKTSAMLGYRWIAFGWLTGTIAGGVNYDALVVEPSGTKDFNAGAQKGFNPALTVSLGIALDPRL